VAELESIYRRRFSDSEARAKDRVWAEIARYLQRYVDPQYPVLDIACDRGYFIRNITAAERWACDRRDVSDFLGEDVRFVRSNGLDLGKTLPAGHFGTIFTSNYLEHLESSEQVLRQIRVAARLLRPGGRLMVLQPNIRLTGAAYWDFIDHKVPLTEKSLAEAGEAAGLATERLVARFLPYTTKSALPQHPWLVRLYLHCRPAWLIMGRQTLYLGRRP
jgi:SAM-dependent methyltransferase